MRLVIEYTVGDGYTYSATETVPVEYESAEAFLVEFEDYCREAKQKKWPHRFPFAGTEWDASNFFEEGNFYPPEVMTVDEWFIRPKY